MEHPNAECEKLANKKGVISELVTSKQGHKFP